MTPAGTGPATVVVAGGVILSVGERPPAGAPVGDSVLMPGLVDTHVHVNEPGRTEWEGFETATRAAAAGGVTTIFDMPLNSVPATTSAEALRVKLAAAKGAATKGAAAKSLPPRFYIGGLDPTSFRAYTDNEMKGAQAALDRLLAVKAKRTIANTLDLYNEILMHSDNAGYASGLMESVHPDSTFRTTAETVTQEVDKFQTDLSLNKTVYDALAAVDEKGLDPDTRYFREKMLKNFRRSGVDRDDATRAKISALNERLTLLSQEFSRIIRNDGSSAA